MHQFSTTELFDIVMSDPSSLRGLDVQATCKLLAEAVRKNEVSSEFSSTMHALETLYIEQFLHTCLIDPDFAAKIHKEMQKYL